MVLGGALACLASVCSMALAATGSICGTLTTTYGARVVNATVDPSPGGASVYSLQDGNYTLSDLQPGTYIVTVTKTDCIISQSHTDVTVVSGQTTTCNFVLQECFGGWPLSMPGSGVANEILEVWGGWGLNAAKSTDSISILHTAVDMRGGNFPNVYAVRAGTTYDVLALGYDSRVQISHADGSELYYHVVPKSGLTDGQTVAAGDLLGTVWTSANPQDDHIHFGVFRHYYYPTAGPVNPLCILVSPPPNYATDRPSIGGIWCVKDPESPNPNMHCSRVDGWQSTDKLFIRLGDTYMVRDRADVVVKAVSLANANPVGIYRLDYRIASDEPATQQSGSLDWTTFVQFDGYEGTMSSWGPLPHNKDTNWANLIFAGDTAWRGDHYYVITNHNDGPLTNLANIAENCWNTRQFHDGKYKLTVNAWDYRRATNPNQQPATLDQPVIVDNTPVEVQDPVKLD